MLTLTNRGPGPRGILTSLSFIVIMLLAVPGCRSGAGVRPAGKTTRTATGFQAHLKIENRASRAERITVRIDSSTAFDGTLQPRGVATPAAIELSRGWHRITTSGSSGVKHQAVVTGDQEQWLLIRRDPGKPEGFGIHVTGRPN
jgi:hypothetical protein